MQYIVKYQTQILAMFLHKDDAIAFCELRKQKALRYPERYYILDIEGNPVNFIGE